MLWHPVYDEDPKDMLLARLNNEADVAKTEKSICLEKFEQASVARETASKQFESAKEEVETAKFETRELEGYIALLGAHWESIDSVS